MELITRIQQIQDEWGLSDEQMAKLCHVSVPTYCQWLVKPEEQGEATVPKGMECAMAVVSIHQSLRAKFPSRDDQMKWLITPHKDFGNHKPLDIAASTPENLNWLGYYLATENPKSR